ncbi:4671_t:CDS:1, partial [Scutellospora calospora]
KKTTSTLSFLNQKIYIDKHPENSPTEKQQDISRTNESNNTQASIFKKTDTIIITTKDTNIEKDSKLRKLA